MDMTEHELDIVIQSQILGKPLVLVFQSMIVLKRIVPAVYRHFCVCMYGLVNVIRFQSEFVSSDYVTRADL